MGRRAASGRLDPRPPRRARSGLAARSRGRSATTSSRTPGLLSTGGGLLFNATYDGWLEALDAETGDLLWRFNLGSGTNGGIISYEAGGKQYIAVATGHGSHVGRALATAYHEDKLINYQEGALVVGSR